MSYIAMHKNINDLVDFKKLRKCNDLCHKWADRLNIPRRKYLNFVYHSYKNPLVHLKKMEIRYRSQYVKDCKTMFYAAEIESILITQYHGMVMKTISSMRVNPNKYEDFLTEGYMGIRSAVWQYRTHKIKASFTTFVFKAIFFRIKGKLHKEKLAKKKMGDIKIILDVDMYKDNEEMETQYGVKDCAINMENINEKVDEIIKNCSLTAQESMLLRSYVDRKVDAPLWSISYRKKYINKQTNKELSRQSICNHLESVRGKIFDYMKRNNMLPEWFIYEEK